MSQIRLNLNLSPELLLDFSLLQLTLVQDFQGADETVLALLSEIDPPKLALPKRTANLEHS